MLRGGARDKDIQKNTSRIACRIPRVSWRYVQNEEGERTHPGGGLDPLRLALSITIVSRTPGVLDSVVRDPASIGCRGYVEGPVWASGSRAQGGAQSENVQTRDCNVAVVGTLGAIMAPRSSARIFSGFTIAFCQQLMGLKAIG